MNYNCFRPRGGCSHVPIRSPFRVSIVHLCPPPPPPPPPPAIERSNDPISVCVYLFRAPCYVFVFSIVRGNFFLVSCRRHARSKEPMDSIFAATNYVSIKEIELRSFPALCSLGLSAHDNPSSPSHQFFHRTAALIFTRNGVELSPLSLFS